MSGTGVAAGDVGRLRPFAARLFAGRCVGVFYDILPPGLQSALPGELAEAVRVVRDTDIASRAPTIRPDPNRPPLCPPDQWTAAERKLAASAGAMARHWQTEFARATLAVFALAWEGDGPDCAHAVFAELAKVIDQAVREERVGTVGAFHVREFTRRARQELDALLREFDARPPRA